MSYLKSPMNYMGNKYKLLKQIVPLFPNDIDVFVDLFCGGLDVAFNTQADRKICNDLEEHLIDFYRNIQCYSGEEVHNKVLAIVKEFDLSLTNSNGYNKLRDTYNEYSREDNWVLFYALLAHSFSHQIRYNSKGHFNIPFGKDRSCYNDKLQARLIPFVDGVNEWYTFCNNDFRDLDVLTGFDNSNCDIVLAVIKGDEKGLICSLSSNSFVYCDPPYLITTATYNENGGWGESEEKDLLAFLDKLNDLGIKFGLSNVISQNGKTNKILDEWSKKYTVHDLNFNYGNSSYHKKDRSTSDTREVFICNY